MKSLFCPKISKNYANIRGKPQKSTFLTPKQMSVPMIRLETMVLMGVQLPLEAIRRQIASGIEILVHLGRGEDGSRRVEEIAEITGMEEDEIKTVSLFRREYGRGLQKTGELVHREKLEGKTG